MQKTKIAVLGDFPEWMIDSTILREGLNYGGCWLVALSEAFRDFDEFEFHWLTPNRSIKKVKTVEKNGQFFHIFPRLKQTIGLYTGYLYERIIVKKILESIDPQLVHAWGTEDIYAICGKYFRGAKLLSMQGVLKASCDRGVMPSFAKKQRFWEKSAIKSYQYFSAESPWCRDRVLEQKSNAVVSLVEYGVEDRFWGIQRNLSDTPTCLYAGSIIELKGIPELVQAFASPELSGITLRLAGGLGSLGEHLQKKSTSNVIWLGRVDRDDMVKELSSAWCLVHPSYADTGPTIVKEARIVGVPVILTVDCGSKQHVTDAKSGFIIPTGDSLAIVKAVLKVVSSRDNALDMGKYQQDQCCEALMPQLTARKFIALYKKIIREYREQTK